MHELIAVLPSTWRQAIQCAALGDALGVPFEFKLGHQVPPMRDIALPMPAGFTRSHAGVPYGYWSDDTSQMLALLDSLRAHGGRFDWQDFSQRLLAWYDEGRYQPAGLVFDCGTQTRHALTLLRVGAYPSSAGTRCGNGALMRVLPVAALPQAYGVSEEAALQTAMAQSALTHPQAISQLLCATYVQLAWNVVKKGAPTSWRAAGLEALAQVGMRLPLSGSALKALQALQGSAARELPSGSGYVVNTFWSALWALDGADSVSAALRRAISLGHDTDTVACVVGGLAGLTLPVDVRAQQWLAFLHAKTKSS